MREVVDARHRAAGRAGEPFAVHPRMQAVTLEVILRAVFGVTDAERGERLRELLRAAARRDGVVRAAVRRAARRAGSAAPDPLAGLAALRREIDALLLRGDRRARARRRRGEDILSLLVAARFEDGEPMDDRSSATSS